MSECHVYVPMFFFLANVSKKNTYRWAGTKAVHRECVAWKMCAADSLARRNEPVHTHFSLGIAHMHNEWPTWRAECASAGESAHVCAAAADACVRTRAISAAQKRHLPRAN